MRCRIGDPDQIRELPLDLGQHRCHLPPQSHVHGQVWTEAPVILGVQAEKGLAKSLSGLAVCKGRSESLRVIGEKLGQGAETKDPAPVAPRVLIVIYSLHCSSEF